ncbi:MAG: 2-amino-4-hydroxy-6-hydroxymethyldihydropteridine diphosphokinase [Candidatus Omnitrophota bacterium]
MVSVFIGIGSNLGDREKNIKRAISAMGEVSGTKVLKVSSIIETEPMYYENQPKFLNCVAKIETAFSARELLKALKTIEKDLGRKESEICGGPREIDLDILIYGDEVIDKPDLKIPHPLMHERPFVLESLAEVR